MGTSSTILLLAITVLTGCGQPKPPPVELRFAPGKWRDMLGRDPMATFAEARPHIKIVQVPPGAEADVLILDSLEVTRAIREGRLLNVLSKMESVRFDLRQFALADIRHGARPDQYFALPVGGGGPAVVYYNADLFKKCNVPAPPITWEWSQFLDAAKALTKDTDGDGWADQFGFLVEPTVDALLPWVWQAAGLSATLDDPKAIQGFKFYADLVRKHKVSPSPSPATGSPAVKLFTTQRLAMFLGGPECLTQLKDVGFEWNVQVPPKGPTGSGTTAHQFFCAIGKSARQPEAAWELVEFLTSSYVGMAVLDSGRLPAREEFFQGFRLHGDKSAWNMEIWGKAYEMAEHIPFPLAYDARHGNRVSQHLTQLLGGKASPDDTAKAVARAVEDIRKTLE